MGPGSRLRALGVAMGMALVFLLATRQLGCSAYSGNAAYRAQVDALLDGRLALTTSPDGLAHDLAWTESGVQQVWGLGVPLWQLPFEAAARIVDRDPFPDRIAMLVWIGLAWFVMFRAFRRADEPWWIGCGSFVITGLLPGFLAMMRGRMGVYEEAAAYAYTAALILMGGLVILGRSPTRTRYLLLVGAAGLTGLIRPTVWFYGFATLVLASAVYLKAHGKRAIAIVAVGGALFTAGGAALYATNADRFGSGTEFGHRLNIHSLPGNIVATRFSYPFERVGWIEASVELVGALFGSPERAATTGFYESDLHAGQSDTVRWREYYFSTFSWPYLPIILAGFVLGLLAWRRRGDRPEPWLATWAILGGLPLAMFYLHSPSLSSRYLLDLAPAIAALLVIAWRAAALHLRERPLIACGVLVALFATAVLTGRTRSRTALDLVDRKRAFNTMVAISRAPRYEHPLPTQYALGDPKLSTWLDPMGRRPQLYLNGSGWGTPARVPVATHFYMTDPEFIEVVVSPATAEVRAAIGLHHLVEVERAPTQFGTRIKLALPDGVTLPGLQVAFLAFGPDTDLGRSRSDVVLHSIRWR